MSDKKNRMTPQGLFLFLGGKMKKGWYEIRSQEEGRGGEKAEIFIYDDIGYSGMTAKDFVEDLKALGDVKELTVRINSYGGEVFAGLAIYNFLARHPANVTVWVDGIAASIASVIAMAGDKVIMPDNAFMMIHRSWGLVIGNAETMEEWAEIMRKFDNSIMLTYQKKSPKPVDEIEQLMSDESWLTAAEAVEWGFADEVSAPVELAARATFRVFNKLPEPLKNAPVVSDNPPRQEPDPAPQPAAIDPDQVRKEAEKAAEERTRAIFHECSEAKVPEAAADFIGEGLTVEEVKARLSNAQAIRDACVAARVPDRAGSYIKAGMNLNEVRAELFSVLAAREVHINNTLGPESGMTGEKPVIDSADIYGRRNHSKAARR